MAPGGRFWSSRQQGIFLAALAGLLIANLVLALVPATAWPVAMTVRSGGFAFPALGDSGQPVRNACLIGLVLAGMLWSRLGHPAAAVRLGVRGAWYRPGDAIVVSAAAAFLLGTCLAYPPQISATNFRIIWVDWAGPDLKIRYFGQVLRTIFYAHPHLLQGAATLAAFFSVHGVARRMGYRGEGASLAGLVVCASSVFVEFAGVGEDWTVVSAASLAVLWAHAARRWGLLVVALVVLGGLRLPSALLLLVAITLAEGVRLARLAANRPGRWRGLSFAPAVRLAAAWAATLILAYLAYLHFTPLGDDMGTPAAQELHRIAVDGFTLTPLSGAYLGHALWAMPAVVLAACVAIALTAHLHVGSATGRNAVVSALAMGGSLLFYELFVEHQFYYNYRYLALAYPLGIPALLFLLGRDEVAPAARALTLATLLVWNPVGPAWRTAAGNLDQRQRLEHELYSCREVLAPWLAQREVYVERSSKALSNAIDYIKDLDGADTSTGARALARPGRRLRANEVLLLRDGSGGRTTPPEGTRRVAECRGWAVFRPR